MEELARTCGERLQDIGHGAVKAFVPHLRGICVVRPSGKDAGVLACAYNVPKLLPAQEIISLHGCVCIGVHTERHGAFYAYPFDLQRELSAPELEGILPHHAVHVGVHNLAHAVSCEPAVPHQGIAVAQICQKEFVVTPLICIREGTETERV